ncbi:4Fe-4S single cluster domain protein [Vibrio phage 150E35-1]|nr:4Fe-4S single cluster domain protein [Vibrio phage 150E35-1]
MKYQQNDAVNGEGVRCTLFVAGCSHGCSGCYNEASWNPSSGHEFTDDMVQQILSDLKDTRIVRSGLSLSGGDPLHKRNYPEILELCKLVRKECPDKTIWMWTGYTIDQIRESGMSEILDYLDVVIDGKFDQDKKDLNLRWRGSSNQVINVLNLEQL